MTRSTLPRSFGPYTLIRRLAVGGMAEVYVAAARGDAGFEKLIALKRIHPHLSSDPEFVSMLIEEAKLSVSLNHQNIVQTFDLGCIEGSYFIIMEHVEGYDLDQVLRALRVQGRDLPLGVAAYVVAEICRGLSHAHGALDDAGRPLHLVHRDVSPQNVLLSLAGEVKVADFGIARTKSRVSDPEAGVIKGKYFYMSPEQAWGNPLDYRSDIFSAGIVLWELLVGETLHRTQQVHALLEEVRRAEVPPPSTRRAEVPAVLDSVVARATARQPSQRFGDAGQLADALCEFLAKGPAEHPAAQLQSLLAAIDPVTLAAPDPAPVDLPRTRDRVITSPVDERPTPSSAPVRFSLDDGEPTVAGWRSPGVRRRYRWLWWAFGAGSLLAAGLWWFRS